jgi:hypothetical protein
MKDGIDCFKMMPTHICPESAKHQLGIFMDKQLESASTLNNAGALLKTGGHAGPPLRVSNK